MATWVKKYNTWDSAQGLEIYIWQLSRNCPTQCICISRYISRFIFSGAIHCEVSVCVCLYVCVCDWAEWATKLVQDVWRTREWAHEGLCSRRTGKYYYDNCLDISLLTVPGEHPGKILSSRLQSIIAHSKWWVQEWMWYCGSLVGGTSGGGKSYSIQAHYLSYTSARCTTPSMDRPDTQVH